MYKNLCLGIIAVLAIAVAIDGANAQVVNFSFEELATDGSNLTQPTVALPLDASHNASSNVVTAAGIDWLLNPGNIFYNGQPNISAISGIGDRNNRAGGVPAPYDPTTVGGNSESFVNAFVEIDAYHDPTFSGTEAGLHDALESILFGGSFDVTIKGLIPGENYVVNLISWDAGVEGEGDGAAGTTKEFRYSTISATSAGSSGSLDYNQFLTELSGDALLGNSSDEITAALIKADFTAAAGQTEITFNMAVTAGTTNDNAIINAVTVFGNLNPVPEPTSALLASMGLVALGLFRRRQ